LLMVFSTMSELCSEFDSSRDDTVFLSYVCSVYRVRRRRRESRRCRDAPVDAPPENLPRETHDPESAVPRSEHSDVDVDRFLWGNRDLHFNCRNLHNTPPVLLNRLCLLAPCCVLGGGYGAHPILPESLRSHHRERNRSPITPKCRG